MSNERKGKDKLFTLIPLEDFKAILSLDDRDDKTARFCLVTASLEIENYCHRHFRNKKYFEFIEYSNDLTLPLKEFPVNEVLAMYVLGTRDWGQGTGELLETEFYRVIPDLESKEDLPYSISLSPAILRMRGIRAFKVIYFAGYKPENIPADLSAACMELAVWKFNRYKGRRVGFTGNVKNNGENIETTMPENVKALLEPYRRKLI